MGDDIKVLHIMGAGRSGSTLLGRLLNEVDGFFATGELRVIWRAGLLQGLRCEAAQRRAGAIRLLAQHLDLGAVEPSGTGRPRGLSATAVDVGALRRLHG